MSLDADYRNIKNWEELYDGDKLNDKATAVVFNTMAIGIGEITSKNLEEVWERTQIVQAVHRNHYLTRDDIDRMLGLRTNVHPKESKRSFMQRMREAALERALREAPARG